MRKIKVAQLGTGHDHARDIARTLKGLDCFDFIGFAEVPEDDLNLKEFTREGNADAYEGVPEYTVEELLNLPGLEAVFIEAEDRALTKYALLAAEKGLHIHMDKPGGVAQEEFDKLIDLVKAKNLILHLGYMYRYNPAVLELKKNIAAGKLGEIISVEAKMNLSHGVEKRSWLAAYPGGMLYFLGCHMIDLVYSILGEPEEVIPLNTVSGLKNVPAEDFGLAMLKYKNGVSFAQSSAVEIGGFNRRQLVVCGTKGTVEIRPLEHWEKSDTIYAPLTAQWREAFENEPECTKTTEIFGRYNAMLEAFAKYVSGEATNPVSYEYERNLHKLLLKACGR